MSADKKLFDLFWFRMALFVPICAALFFTSIIIYNSDLRFDFTYRGFNEILTIFKFPLWILATIVPGVALVAANHRSVQSSKQINLSRGQITAAQEQNIFQNYYTHLDKFESYCKELISYNEIAIIKRSSPRSIHSKIYPRARQGVFTVSEGISDFLSQKNSELQSYAYNFILLCEKDIKLAEDNFENEIRPLVQQTKVYFDYCNDVLMLEYNVTTLGELFITTSWISRYINNVMSFDGAKPIGSIRDMFIELHTIITDPLKQNGTNLDVFISKYPG